MIIHSKIEHKELPEDNYWFVYRWNDDLNRVEYWSKNFEYWTQYSLVITKEAFLNYMKSSKNYYVTYQSSWAEPNEYDQTN